MRQRQSWQQQNRKLRQIQISSRHFFCSGRWRGWPPGRRALKLAGAGTPPAPAGHRTHRRRGRRPALEGPPAPSTNPSCAGPRRCPTVPLPQRARVCTYRCTATLLQQVSRGTLAASCCGRIHRSSMSSGISLVFFAALADPGSSAVAAAPQRVDQGDSVLLNLTVMDSRHLMLKATQNFSREAARLTSNYRLQPPVGIHSVGLSQWVDGYSSHPPVPTPENLLVGLELLGSSTRPRFITIPSRTCRLSCTATSL